MIRRLLHFFIGHRHLWRETVKGERFFVCECGYRVPQITRTPLQRIAFKRSK